MSDAERWLPSYGRAYLGVMAHDDSRYIEIEGRRWRRSDPEIPEPLRTELVGELMHARRAVRSAKQTNDARAERAARARVQDAKVALGERGPQWWEPLDGAAQELRARAAMRALVRSRGPEKSICPSDVARVIGQSAWRALMPLVREVALALRDEGVLELRQRGERLAGGAKVRGPLRIALSADGSESAGASARARD